MKPSSLAVPVILVGSSMLLAGCTPLDSLKMTLIEKIPALAMIPGIAPKDSAIGQVAEVGKLSMMVATGQSGKCIITDKNTNAITEYYVKGKKMKFSTQGTNMMMPDSTSDEPMPSGTANKKSYFLNDTEYTYMWQEGEKNGIKTKLEAPTKPENSPTTAAEVGDSEQTSMSDEPAMDISKFEQDINYSISCDLTDLSDSEFMPPADVTFMDYSQMNEQNFMMYMQDNTQAKPSNPGKTAPAGKKMPADSMPELDPETQKMIDAYTNQMETAPADQ